MVVDEAEFVCKPASSEGSFDLGIPGSQDPDTTIEWHNLVAGHRNGQQARICDSATIRNPRRR